MPRSLFFICFLFLIGNAKSTPFDSSRIINAINYLTIGYGKSLPGGELIKRFGTISNVSAGFFHKNKNNIVMGLEGNMLFGTNVKENNMFESITGPSGGLIDANGNIAIIRLYMRGFAASFSLGKLFNLSPRSPNSGILFLGSIGFIQHKIKFIYSQKILPQLDGDYFKGYDRLTNGVLVKQFLGYQHFSKKYGAHFYIGAEIGEGFTENRRSYNYDQRQADITKRIDLITTFKAGLIIPLGNKHRNEEEFFQ